MKIYPFIMASMLLTLLAAPSQATNAAAEGKEHTIYLVRHAEKQKGKNPALTAEGQCRAQFYAQYFSRIPLDRLFASHYRRNQETAAPVKEKRGLDALPFDPSQQVEFAQELATLHGDTLVVAHNHLPEIIRALGGDYQGDIDHEEYRYIFSLELKGGKLVKQRLFIGPYFSKDCQANI
ncbi:histidine phosphatase family protein [Pseudoteredinibacter isoporae]|uniref:Broad specificity phosphatase PhoE n=1 Tax=Pseudoteredinibacter isoporae TaxID=570281 RepID=A0A7X0JT32_9GAMM|nr:phosphoglycerate mutase family protein [Pseudoteredinibacter isoporae]MBB6520821.1 broad specificity phosphatase PhoE [Pseudoteredinibacter isoporae]NHO86387.1 histidine phosphatase family protein [Pseudoteredinibacter isoporae]NIB25161.1 histidine phosphatase family protein [Pseudoteredinibacter isoporae]